MLLWVEVVSADTLVVDLPGGNLREALLLFGQQTQTSVFFAEETVAGIEHRREPKRLKSSELDAIRGSQRSERKRGGPRGLGRGQ